MLRKEKKKSVNKPKMMGNNDNDNNLINGEYFAEKNL